MTLLSVPHDAGLQPTPWNVQPAFTDALYREFWARARIASAFWTGGGDIVRNYAPGGIQGTRTVNADWILGPRGQAIDLTTGGNDRVDFGANSNYPLSNMTAFIAYRKTDGTNRTSGGWGNDDADAARACGVHLPWSDGNVYWDFGGNGAGNRVSASGLTFGDDIWAFTVGARGQEIWQNGVRVAYNASNNPTRESSANPMSIGHHTPSGDSDNAECSMFAILDGQASIGLIEDVSHDRHGPYRLDYSQFWGKAPAVAVGAPGDDYGLLPLIAEPTPDEVVIYA